MAKHTRKTTPKQMANLRPPWQPGQTGNPEGRKKAGAVLRDWLNALVEKGLSEQEIRKIALDQKEPLAKRAAAVRLLRMVEVPDLADVESYLEGETTLAELRAGGLNTALVKRAKVRTLKGGIVERELELYDRGGEDFDRVVDHTDGKARQAVEVTGNVAPIIQIITPLTHGATPADNPG